MKMSVKKNLYEIVVTQERRWTVFEIFQTRKSPPKYETAHGTLDVYGKELFARFMITGNFLEDTSFLPKQAAPT